MTYSPTDIKQYFDDFADQETERLVADPVAEVSLAIHNEFAEKSVKGTSRILEVGAGSGRFTRQLASFGAELTVTDISDVQLKLNQQYGKELGYFNSVQKWNVADITDLSAYENASFDAIVGFGGPLSYTLDQRYVALREFNRVLAPGGVICLSVMSLWGTIHRALPGVLSVSAESNQAIIATGDITEKTMPERNGHYMHLFTSDELKADIEGEGFSVVSMSASNFLTTSWDEQLKETKLSKAKWNEVVTMEKAACSQPGALNAGTHILVCAKKKA